ncbi:hypothetical protein D3C73_1595360 [compost metagenome]
MHEGCPPFRIGLAVDGDEQDGGENVNREKGGFDKTEIDLKRAGAHLSSLLFKKGGILPGF